MRLTIPMVELQCIVPGVYGRTRKTVQCICISLQNICTGHTLTLFVGSTVDPFQFGPLTCLFNTSPISIVLYFENLTP